MKKFVSLVLALVLCASLSVPAWAAEFTDVPAEHAFYDAIMDCSEKGIVGGYDDGTFRPTNTVAKSHFCAMLARAFYPDQISEYDTDWYKNEYGTFGPTNMVLSVNEILNNTSFRWSFNNAADMGTGINRYDMAQMMANILAEKGFSVSESDKDAAAAKITDYADIPEQYRDAVTSVYALGMIGGYSDGTFGGDGIMNRGQAAVVIYRLAQYAGTETGTGPETSVSGDLSGVLENPAGSTPSETAPDTSADPDHSKPNSEAPERSETPSVSTLTNGEEITEENVLAILNDLKAQWNKKDMGPYSQGGKSAIRSVTNRYRISGSNLAISTSRDCGGGAARVFDAVFGQNVTLRPVSGGYDAARPGDLLIKVDPNGKLMHVAIVYDRGTINGIANMLTTIDANINGGGNKLLFGGARYDPIKYDDPWNYHFYTAYPD